MKVYYHNLSQEIFNKESVEEIVRETLAYSEIVITLKKNGRLYKLKDDNEEEVPKAIKKARKLFLTTFKQIYDLNHDGSNYLK